MIVLFTIQGVSLYQRFLMKNINRNYLICQGALFFFLTVSILETVVCLILDIYPLITFILKGFVIILLIRHLRFSWINNIKILYKTKTIFFLIALNVGIFGLIGFFLFQNCEDFKDIFISMYSLYVLLSTCNFPDVMLGTFKASKFSIFFFAFYIIVNLYIFLSMLRALFFSNYFDLYKNKIETLIEEIEKEDNYPLYKEKTFADLLFKLNSDIKFTKEEYTQLLTFLGLNNEKLKFTTKFKEAIKKEKLMGSNRILQFLNKKRVEIIIDCVDFALIYILFTSIAINHVLLIFQIFWCLVFILEFFVHFHYLGIKNFLKTEFLRFLFYVDNFLSFICLLCLEYYNIAGQQENRSILFEFTKPLVVLRSIRIFVFLNLFNEFKIIFLALKNMRRIFIELLINLFSFYFIFSSLTMLITGGNIMKNSFINNREIPNNYFHINFNDFGSSFLACFALTMINNLQILAKSLSYHAKTSGGDRVLNSYFATFYFFSTLLILNIFQTLILEMYLTLKAKHIISSKKKKKRENTLQKVKEYVETDKKSDNSSSDSEKSSMTDN